MHEQVFLECEKCHDKTHELDMGRFQSSLLCFDCESREKQALIAKLRAGNQAREAKPSEPTANHCIEHPIYKVETHPLPGERVVLSTREAKPTWLHSPSLCDKGGCPECEIVSDK